MNKELIVIIQAQGTFELDWQISTDPMESSQLNFQEEFYPRFVANPPEALLVLGFSDRTLPLSESLHFLRHVAAAFVKKLSLNPNIEVLREKIRVEIEEEEIKHFLLKSPYLQGAEYLDHPWIEEIWFS